MLSTDRPPEVTPPAQAQVGDLVDALAVAMDEVEELRRQAREKAAKSCGVDVAELDTGTEHAWGWSFVVGGDGPGAGPVFVDAKTGLVATNESGDAERLALLQAGGPLNVPPWKPLPKRTWWQTLRRALGLPGRS